MMAAVKNNLNTPSILGGSEHAGPTGFLNSCNVMAVAGPLRSAVVSQNICGSQNSLIQLELCILSTYLMAAGSGEIGDMGAGGVGPGGEFRGEVGGMGGGQVAWGRK